MAYTKYFGKYGKIQKEFNQDTRQPEYKCVAVLLRLANI